MWAFDCCGKSWSEFGAIGSGRTSVRSELGPIKASGKSTRSPIKYSQLVMDPLLEDARLQLAQQSACLPGASIAEESDWEAWGKEFCRRLVSLNN